jgi:hypothetical protein
MRRVGIIVAAAIAAIGIGVVLVLPNGCHYPHGLFTGSRHACLTTASPSGSRSRSPGSSQAA